MPESLSTCPFHPAICVFSINWSLPAPFRRNQTAPGFGALQRTMPGTWKLHPSTLPGVEADQVVWRQSEPSAPQHATYGSTERGLALTSLFDALSRCRLGDTIAARNETVAS